MSQKQSQLKYFLLTIAIIVALVFLLKSGYVNFYSIIIIGGLFVVISIYYISIKPMKEKGNIEMFDLTKSKFVWSDEFIYLMSKNKRKEYIEKINKSPVYHHHLSVLDTGLRFHKYYLKWHEIKSVTFSKKMLGTHFMASIFSRPAFFHTANATLFVKDIRDKKYYIDVIDVPGFILALNQVGQVSLFSREDRKKYFT